MDDMSRSGRWEVNGKRRLPTRENHHSSKLTEVGVSAIRASTQPTKELAVIYGVNKSTIVRVRSGIYWK